MRPSHPNPQFWGPKKKGSRNGQNWPKGWAKSTTFGVVFYSNVAQGLKNQRFYSPIALVDGRGLRELNVSPNGESRRQTPLGSTGSLSKAFYSVFWTFLAPPLHKGHSTASFEGRPSLFIKQKVKCFRCEIIIVALSPVSSIIMINIFKLYVGGRNLCYSLILSLPSVITTYDAQEHQQWIDDIYICRQGGQFILMIACHASHRQSPIILRVTLWMVPWY